MRIRAVCATELPTMCLYRWLTALRTGDFKIHEVDKVSKRLHEQYGDFVKVEGLLNRPDMVFVYDADEIERIFRQEERMPHRPKMPSLDYYKHRLRKHVFSRSPGVIAVYAPQNLSQNRLYSLDRPSSHDVAFRLRTGTAQAGTTSAARCSR